MVYCGSPEHQSSGDLVFIYGNHSNLGGLLYRMFCYRSPGAMMTKKETKHNLQRTLYD
jgi:hypothetical protein